ncbi:Hypothetical predicted protein, partial [Paramuricea clavata]
MASQKIGKRVQWRLTSSEGISFPFDGVPFLCVGTVNYQCHQGDDIDLKTKMKRQEDRDKNENHDHTFRKRRKHYQPSKKLGQCPSQIIMSRVLKFPDYKVVVGPNGGKPQRKMREAAASLKADLQAGTKLAIIDQFAIKLPNINSHKFHTTEGE